MGQFKTDLSFFRKDKEEPSPVHSLGLHSKMEESILIESDYNISKVPSFDINTLEKLGKIGKMCQSLTP